ncbi:unnamed protein product, partial [Mycena citricolor]
GREGRIRCWARVAILVDLWLGKLSLIKRALGWSKLPILILANASLRTLRLLLAYTMNTSPRIHIVVHGPIGAFAAGV